jgi:PilX N-terminal
MHTRTRQAQRSYREKGVVLVVALLMLVVLSLLVAASIKGSGSSEAISSNNRTQTLAMQAADAALRYCEEGVKNQIIAGAVGVGIYNGLSITPEDMPAAGDFTWATKSNWNANPKTASIFVLDPVGGTSYLPAAIYQRMPECMAQFVDAAKRNVVVTARGFGPEVTTPAAGAASREPDGSQVFVQVFLSF